MASDPFDSLMAGAAQPLAALAGMLGQQRQANLQLADRQQAREAGAAQFMMQLDDRRQQADENRQVSRDNIMLERERMSMAREQNQFTRLQAGLDFQLKLADRERADRDASFEQTLRLMQVGAQAQLQGLELKQLAREVEKVEKADRAKEVLGPLLDRMQSMEPNSTEWTAALDQLNNPDTEVGSLLPHASEAYRAVLQAFRETSRLVVTDQYSADIDAYGTNPLSQETLSKIAAKTDLTSRISLDSVQLMSKVLMEAPTEMDKGDPDAVAEFIRSKYKGSPSLERIAGQLESAAGSDRFRKLAAAGAFREPLTADKAAELNEFAGFSRTELGQQLTALRSLGLPAMDRAAVEGALHREYKAGVERRTLDLLGVDAPALAWWETQGVDGPEALMAEITLGHNGKRYRFFGDIFGSEFTAGARNLGAAVTGRRPLEADKRRNIFDWVEARVQGETPEPVTGRGPEFQKAHRLVEEHWNTYVLPIQANAMRLTPELLAEQAEDAKRIADALFKSYQIPTANTLTALQYGRMVPSGIVGDADLTPLLQRLGVPVPTDGRTSNTDALRRALGLTYTNMTTPAPGSTQQQQQGRPPVFSRPGKPPADD